MGSGMGQMPSEFFCSSVAFMRLKADCHIQLQREAAVNQFACPAVWHFSSLDQVALHCWAIRFFFPTIYLAGVRSPGASREAGLSLPLAGESTSLHGPGSWAPDSGSDSWLWPGPRCSGHPNCRHDSLHRHFLELLLGLNRASGLSRSQEGSR